MANQKRRERIRLKPREYGEAYTLVERCLGVGDDPYGWRLRFLQGLREVFGASWAYIGEHKIVGPSGSDGWIQPSSLVHHGIETEHQQMLFWSWIRHGRPEKNPMVVLLMSQEWFGSHRMNVMHRSGFVDDDAWYASPFYTEFCEPAGYDDMLGSSYLTPAGDFYWVVLQRDRGEANYTFRDRRRLAVLTHLLIREIGKGLAGTEQDSVLKLPLRQRQVLQRLLEGDSTKQVGSHLGISVHTVDQYIQRLHKGFAVSSRGELLARTRYLADAISYSVKDAKLDHDKQLRQAMRAPWPMGDVSDG